MAAHISSFNHGCPVCIGQPKVAHLLSNSDAGWCKARPVGHIEFLYVDSGSAGGPVANVPRVPWTVHCFALFCSDLSRRLRCLLSRLMILRMSPEERVTVYRALKMLRAIGEALEAAGDDSVAE